MHLKTEQVLFQQHFVFAVWLAIAVQCGVPQGSSNSQFRLNSFNLSRFLKECKAAGKTTMVWTVNDPLEMAEVSAIQL